MSNREKFGWDDVVEGQRGIFGQAEASVTGRGAMDDWISARTQPSPEGLVIRLMCESCGTPREVTPEYAELIAIKYGLQPHVAFQGQQNVLKHPTVWGFDQNHRAWFPDAKCPCGMALRPLITVAEAGKALDVAVNSGWIPLKYVQDLSKYCAQLQMQQMQQRGG